jgi:hypothetical protein
MLIVVMARIKWTRKQYPPMPTIPSPATKIVLIVFLSAEDLRSSPSPGLVSLDDCRTGWLSFGGSMSGGIRLVCKVERGQDGKCDRFVDS